MLIFCGTVFVESARDVLARVNDCVADSHSMVVLFDAARIAGESHIRSAVMHAERSFAETRNIARTKEMEILVYASGQRQCSLAAKFGLHAGENKVYVLISGGDEERARQALASIVTPTPAFPVDVKRLQELFGISDAELETVGADRVEELVVERVALVDAWR